MNILIGMKKIFAVAILASFVLTLAPVSLYAQQGSIGVFDLQKALSDSKKGKAARANLENKFKKMQNELKAKENELNKLSGELRTMVEKKTGTQDDLRARDEALKKKVAAYQEQLGKYNEDMRKSEESALKPLVDQAVQTAGDLGRSRGYLLVLEVQQAGVIYAEDQVDLTPEIIKVIDK